MDTSMSGTFVARKEENGLHTNPFSAMNITPPNIPNIADENLNRYNTETAFCIVSFCRLWNVMNLFVAFNGSVCSGFPDCWMFLLTCLFVQFSENMTNFIKPLDGILHKYKVRLKIICDYKIDAKISAKNHQLYDYFQTIWDTILL